MDILGASGSEAVFQFFVTVKVMENPVLSGVLWFSFVWYNLYISRSVNE